MGETDSGLSSALEGIQFSDLCHTSFQLPKSPMRTMRGQTEMTLVLRSDIIGGSEWGSNPPTTGKPAVRRF